ncbi:MAG: efflux RND transporter periplasmic adaptor subunit [Campylobacterales bacterium]|nr:efflux RND transporter periplasmic adaptor subunit [Campylobacterales bacterium]
MKKVKFFLIIVSIVMLSGCFQEEKENRKFYGNVDVRTVSLAFRVSGRLEAVHFDEGQKVKKGDLIAKLDDALFQEQLKAIDAQIAMQKAALAKLQKGYRPEEIAKAKAQMLQAKVSRDRTLKEYERMQKLYTTKTISDQKYDDAKAAYESSEAKYLYAKSAFEMFSNGYEQEDILAAKAKLTSLQAQRALAKINLDDTLLYAPHNGTVITRIYEAGSIVSPSQAVVEIAKDDEYWVRSYMSERYLGIIKTGLKAVIYSDNGKSYEGRVSFISSIAEFTPKTVQTEDLRTDLVYRFRIVLDNYDESIRQGMPVTITFPTLQ